MQKSCRVFLSTENYCNLNFRDFIECQKNVKECCDVFGKFNRKTTKAVTEIDFTKNILEIRKIWGNNDVFGQSDRKTTKAAVVLGLKHDRHKKRRVMWFTMSSIAWSHFWIRCPRRAPALERLWDNRRCGHHIVPAKLEPHLCNQ